MDLAQLNIKNLVSLWQRVGERAGRYTSGTDFDFCLTPDSDWPNRLWFHGAVTEKILKAAQARLRTLPLPLIVPLWDLHQNPLIASLPEANGFQRVSEQTGMYLPLDGTCQTNPDVVLAEVDGEAAARLWSELFQSAFNYRISHRLLWPGHQGIRCLIAYHHHEPVGTAMLHSYPDAVLGVHAVGIIPQMHRRGLGEKLMQNLLHQARTEGFAYATLQASQTGRELYAKLGFQPQLKLQNYVLQK